MAVHFDPSIKRSAPASIPPAAAPAKARKQRGPGAPRPPVDLTYDGRLYAVDLARVLRVSKTTLWAGLKRDEEGRSRFPQPDGRDSPHKPWWLTSTVRTFLGDSTRVQQAAEVSDGSLLDAPAAHLLTSRPQESAK